jgi:hypothetical protein
MTNIAENIERLQTDNKRLRLELRDVIIQRDALMREPTEITKLKAMTAHAARFLDGMAARIEGWACTKSETEDIANIDKAAQDCRMMAASLKPKPENKPEKP